jgi:hypothetical protein
MPLTVDKNIAYDALIHVHAYGGCMNDGVKFGANLMLAGCGLIIFVVFGLLTLILCAGAIGLVATAGSSGERPAAESQP